MATRFYIDAASDVASSLTPAAWTNTANMLRREMATAQNATTDTNSGVLGGAANNTAVAVQAFSPPLNAQTISGTITVVSRARELVNTDNINKRWLAVRVVASDLTTVRGTLFALAATASTTELTTAISAQVHANAAALTSVVAQANDRIVVEYGYGESSTGTSPQWDSVIGGSGTDATATDNSATGTVPWIEFSANLTFAPVPKSGSDVASAVDSGSRKIPGATYLPPTIVSTTNLTEGSGTRSFASIAVQAGDWVVVQAIGDELIGGFTASATGWTFTQQVENSEFGIGVQTVHTAFADASTSKTITVAPADGTASYRAVATVVRGSDGPGVSTAGPGQDRQITPSETGSAIFIGITDGDGGSVGGGLTWYNGGQTVVASANVGIQNYIFGRDNDSGDPAAAQFQGISVPTFNNPSIVLFEMLGFPDTAPSATAKSGSDTGSGTDAGTLAVALTPATDAESGVDAATLLASQTRAETSSAVESASVSTLTDKSGSDTSSATDAGTLGTTLTPATDARTGTDASTVLDRQVPTDARTIADAGTLGVTLTPATDLRTVVDAGTLLASFTGTDLGGSADAPSGPLSATLAGADTGAMGTEAWQLSVVLQSAETGAGADAASVDAAATAKSGADTATAVDAATLAASQTRADTAGAVDVATLVVNFTASDLSSIVDTVQALAATHTGADTGSQTESQTVNAGGNVSGGDTSSVTEGRTLTVSLTGADTSTTIENQTVLPTIPQSGSDTGSTVENRTLTVQLTASEIVTAIEGFSLSAGANRAGADTSTVQESILLTVSVSRGDTVTSIDQGFLTLLKSGTETSTLVDSASLLAQLTLAEIVAAAEVLAVLTGPQVWNFISADVRAITTGTEAGSGVQATEFSNSTQTTEFNSNGTQISVAVTW